MVVLLVTVLELLDNDFEYEVTAFEKEESKEEEDSLSFWPE